MAIRMARGLCCDEGVEEESCWVVAVGVGGGSAPVGGENEATFDGGEGCEAAGENRNPVGVALVW